VSDVAPCSSRYTPSRSSSRALAGAFTFRASDALGPALLGAGNIIAAALDDLGRSLAGEFLRWQPVATRALVAIVLRTVFGAPWQRVATEFVDRSVADADRRKSGTACRSRPKKAGRASATVMAIGDELPTGPL
jgi:hypothetical protein